MKKLLRLLFLLSLGFISGISALSCKNETNVVSKPQPKATMVYSKNGISINSYDFKTFESFLTRQNDTIYVVNF